MQSVHLRLGQGERCATITRDVPKEIGGEQLCGPEETLTQSFLPAEHPYRCPPGQCQAARLSLFQSYSLKNSVSYIYLLHARGQNAIATVDVQFVCGVGANSGAFHFSYCTNVETLKSRCTHQSSFMEPSFTVSPPGMKLLSTLACRYPNSRVFRGLNQYLLQD